MRSPFAALAERFRRRPAGERPPTPEPLPARMADGAADFQARLDDARERLRRDIPPPADDGE
ncbi:MAG TPA: hypothetical protein VF549_02700 [Solirubrobacteraceae bacterium]